MGGMGQEMGVGGRGLEMCGVRECVWEVGKCTQLSTQGREWVMGAWE